METHKVVKFFTRQVFIINEYLVIALLEGSPIAKEVTGNSYVLTCKQLAEWRSIAYLETFRHQRIR